MFINNISWAWKIPFAIIFPLLGLAFNNGAIYSFKI